MGVASTSDYGTPSNFTNYGPDVWVAAPGEGIVSTYPYGTYSAGWGTSFSAPFVSGTAALLVNVSSNVNQQSAAAAIAHANWISERHGKWATRYIPSSCSRGSRQRAAVKAYTACDLASRVTNAPAEGVLPGFVIDKHTPRLVRGYSKTGAKRSAGLKFGEVPPLFSYLDFVQRRLGRAT